MLIESKSPYDFVTIVGKFEQAIAKQGWKVPAVHDLQATMHNFGKTVSPVKYLNCVIRIMPKKSCAKAKKESYPAMPCLIAIY